MTRCLLALACVAAWPAVAQPPAQDRNAALDYSRAALLNSRAKTEATSNLDWKAIGDQTDPAKLPQEFRDAVAEVSPEVVAACIRGSHAARCDFQVAYEEGIYALLPHLGPMRQSARMLRVDARRCLSEGDVAGAAERIAAMAGMAAHVKTDRLLISNLVGAAILKLAIQETGAALASGKLTPESRRTLSVAFQRFTGEDPFGIKEAIATGERTMTLTWIKNTFHGPTAGQDFEEKIGYAVAIPPAPGAPAAPAPATQSPPSPPPPPAPFSDDKARAAIRMMNGDQLSVAVDLAAPAYTLAVAAYDEPDGAERLKALAERVNRGDFGPVAYLLSPAVSRARESDYKLRAEVAHLLEALAKQ